MRSGIIVHNICLSVGHLLNIQAYDFLVNQHLDYLGEEVIHDRGKTVLSEQVDGVEVRSLPTFVSILGL